MIELETLIDVLRIIWPIPVWVAWVNHNVKQHQKDIDHWYFMQRGVKGKRCRSMRAQFKREFYNLKGKLNVRSNRGKSSDQIIREALNRKVSSKGSDPAIKDVFPEHDK